MSLTGRLNVFIGFRGSGTPNIDLWANRTLIADELGSNERALAPLARASCCARASLWVKGTRCARLGMRAPSACILEVERCAHLACFARLGRPHLCEALAPDEKFTPMDS